MLSRLMTESIFDSPEIAAQWRAGAERRNAFLKEATERMLDAAGVVSGARVLDLGTGTGDTAVLAALRVGPSGRVLATDISEAMLKAAAETAKEAAAGNLDFQLADAGALELDAASFDAVIARFSLMFVPDLPAALGGIFRVLRPAGGLGAIVWASAEENPFLSFPARVARRTDRLRLPEERVAGPFALSDADGLEKTARDAGWQDVAVEHIALEMRLPDIASASEALRNSPLARAITEALEGAERTAFQDDARAELEVYRAGDGYLFPGRALLLRGRKGS
jgi:ubiquinone/menaquinone biosynthesis C-methylase UbiE